MPELPDVETMRRYLQATALHKTIHSVEVFAFELLSDTSSKRLASTLVGRTFKSTHRHGKFLFVALGDKNPRHMALHFGMTGSLSYFKESNPKPNFEQIRFGFKNGYALSYQSKRKLGEVVLLDEMEKFIAQQDLGPDALELTRRPEWFRHALADRRTMAKSALMDQKTMAGIGNIYADEILFQAAVHPRTKIKDLDGHVFDTLCESTHSVLRTAIACKADPERFPDNYLIAERHDAGRCPRCNAALEHIKISGRSTYFCPQRQKKIA
jgi:formamidopyrimidine-DNA glycosylase